MDTSDDKLQDSDSEGSQEECGDMEVITLSSDSEGDTSPAKKKPKMAVRGGRRVRGESITRLRNKATRKKERARNEEQSNHQSQSRAGGVGGALPTEGQVAAVVGGQTEEMDVMDESESNESLCSQDEDAMCYISNVRSLVAENTTMKETEKELRAENAKTREQLTSANNTIIRLRQGQVVDKSATRYRNQNGEVGDGELDEQIKLLTLAKERSENKLTNVSDILLLLQEEIREVLDDAEDEIGADLDGIGTAPNPVGPPTGGSGSTSRQNADSETSISRMLEQMDNVTIQMKEVVERDRELNTNLAATNDLLLQIQNELVNLNSTTGTPGASPQESSASQGRRPSFFSSQEAGPSGTSSSFSRRPDAHRHLIGFDSDSD